MILGDSRCSYDILCIPKTSYVFLGNLGEYRSLGFIRNPIYFYFFLKKSVKVTTRFGYHVDNKIVAWLNVKNSDNKSDIKCQHSVNKVSTEVLVNCYQRCQANCYQSVRRIVSSCTWRIVIKITRVSSLLFLFFFCFLLFGIVSYCWAKRLFSRQPLASTNINNNEQISTNFFSKHQTFSTPNWTPYKITIISNSCLCVHIVDTSLTLYVDTSLTLCVTFVDTFL